MLDHPRAVSFQDTCLGCWRGHLQKYQTVALLFWVIAGACGLRMIINLVTNYWGGVFFLAPLTLLYTYAGTYVTKQRAVPTAFAESMCVVTMLAIIVHDMCTGGQLDIWWLLLLVVDALFLCDARAAVRNGVTLTSLVYVLLSVVEETFGFGLYSWAESERYFENGPGQPKHGAWGISVGIVRISVFFGNHFIVYGIAASQQRMIRLINTISSDLAVFDLDAAERALALHKGQRSDVEPLIRLAHNLRRYKPYLPAEIYVNDPEKEQFCTQNLAAVKVHLGNLPCDMKYSAMQNVFHQSRIRGGWVHSFEACSALVLFGAQRLHRAYLEGIWGAGCLFFEIRRTSEAVDSGLDPEDEGELTFKLRVLGSTQFVGDSYVQLERVGRAANGRVAATRAPKNFPQARYVCQIGGAVVWIGGKQAASGSSARRSTSSPSMQKDAAAAVARSDGYEFADITDDAVVNERQPMLPALSVRKHDSTSTTGSSASEGGGSSSKKKAPFAFPCLVGCAEKMVRNITPPEKWSDVDAAADGDANDGGGRAPAADFPDVTLEVYIQESAESDCVLAANLACSAKGGETPCKPGEFGRRTLSRLHGITNLAGEAALAIQDFCATTCGVQASIAVVLDPFELGAVGGSERKTIVVQGPGIDRVEDLFGVMSDLNTSVRAPAGEAVVGCYLGSPGAAPPGAVASGNAAPQQGILCNGHAAAHLQSTHGISAVDTGAPGDAAVYTFGDRDMTSRIHRNEMHLLSELPADRLVDQSDLSPRETWTKIGEGKTGAVYAARCIKLHKDVAVKELHPNAKPEERVMFLQELLAMNKVRWDSVCNFFGYSQGPHGAVYIVMELCQQGPLQNIVYGSRLTDTERAGILRDVGQSISQALAYIHQKKLVHMDVASRNVLVTADGQYRLADLGFLTPMGERSKRICYPWAPPEAVRSFPDVDASFAYDIWSFGMLGYEILAGAPPFGKHAKLKDIKDALAAGRLPHPPPCVQRDVACEKLWREMVLPCLAHTPLSRPGMSQLASLCDRNFAKDQSTTSFYLAQGSNGSASQSNPSNPFNSNPSVPSADQSTVNPYSSTTLYGSGMYGSSEVYGTVPTGGAVASPLDDASPVKHADASPAAAVQRQ